MYLSETLISHLHGRGYKTLSHVRSGHAGLEKQWLDVGYLRLEDGLVEEWTIYIRELNFLGILLSHESEHWVWMDHNHLGKLAVKSVYGTIFRLIKGPL